MSVKFNIYQATQADFDDALALLIRFFDEEGFETPHHLMEPPLHKMITSPDHAVFLAALDKKPVGVATVTAMTSVEYGRIAEIDDLYVLPQYRGQQIAKNLIDKVKNWCRTQECTALIVTVTPEGQEHHDLKAFYAKRGFVSTGRVILESTL